MDERLRFVARLLDGESMSEVCREFGISRKTGYKIFTRYKDEGLEALTDRSRRPVRYANQLQCLRAYTEGAKDIAVANIPVIRQEPFMQFDRATSGDKSRRRSIGRLPKSCENSPHTSGAKGEAYEPNRGCRQEHASRVGAQTLPMCARHRKEASLPDL